MVKNTKGGSSHKKQARKYTGDGGGFSKTRFSEDPCEIYACCNKLLGNGTCSVLCQDNVERLCIIRKKFRGRGKRNNVVAPGVWVLVGKRDFEGKHEGKKEKTDLLEVYSNSDKKKLQQSVTGVKWTIFNGLGTSIAGESEENDNLVFGDEQTLDYLGMIEENDDESNSDGELTNTVVVANDGEDEIDVNDI